MSNNFRVMSLPALAMTMMVAACAAPTAAPAPTQAPAAAAPTAAPATAAPAAVPATPVPAPTITPVPLVAQPAGSTKVVFWYGLGGQLGNVVRQVVNKYNQSQQKCFVDPVFQASYDDTINKINASLAGGGLPNVAQVFDAGTQRMIDTKKIVPVQDLLERDKLTDVLDDLEPAVRGYYSVGGKLYSMPFNSSTAMVYYNKKAFKDAGLDPEKKIWSYDDVAAFAKATTHKDAAGKVDRIGIAFSRGGWFVEQQLAVHEQLLVEPGNGRTERGTKFVWNNDIAAKWFELLKKTIDDGTGRYYQNAADPQAAFVKGEAAIHFDSIAALRGIVGGVESNKTGVDVGVAYMPRLPDAKGRTIIGGASLWLTTEGGKELQDCGWDFMKFASTSENQAFFSSNTGYYPTRRSAYALDDMKTALAKYPQFQVAIDQIRSAPASAFNSGGISGTFLPSRLEVEKAQDEFWSGKQPTAKAALDAAAKRANDLLDEYNSTLKK